MQVLARVDVPPGKPGCDLSSGAGAWVAWALVGAALLRRRRP